MCRRFMAVLLLELEEGKSVAMKGFVGEAEHLVWVKTKGDNGSGRGRQSQEKQLCSVQKQRHREQRVQKGAGNKVLDAKNVNMHRE